MTLQGFIANSKNETDITNKMLPVLCDCFDGFDTKKERAMCKTTDWVCNPKMSPDDLRQKHPECGPWIDYATSIAANIEQKMLPHGTLSKRHTNSHHNDDDTETDTTTDMPQVCELVLQSLQSQTEAMKVCTKDDGPDMTCVRTTFLKNLGLQRCQ